MASCIEDGEKRGHG